MTVQVPYFLLMMQEDGYLLKMENCRNDSSISKCFGAAHSQGSMSNRVRMENESRETTKVTRRCEEWDWKQQKLPEDVKEWDWKQQKLPENVKNGTGNNRSYQKM